MALLMLHYLHMYKRGSLAKIYQKLFFCWGNNVHRCVECLKTYPVIVLQNKMCEQKVLERSSGPKPYITENNLKQEENKQLMSMSNQLKVKPGLHGVLTDKTCFGFSQTWVNIAFWPLKVCAKLLKFTVLQFSQV